LALFAGASTVVAHDAYKKVKHSKQNPFYHYRFVHGLLFEAILRRIYVRNRRKYNVSWVKQIRIKVETDNHVFQLTTTAYTT